MSASIFTSGDPDPARRGPSELRRAAAVVVVALLAFALVTAVGMIRRPEAAREYARGRLVWDAVHFHTIAAKGYLLEDPGLGNYFPLWPLVLRTVFSRESVAKAGLPAALLAFVLFAASLWPVTLKTLRLFGWKLGGALVLAWALNPMSIFHALSYSESLFCFWAGFFLLALPDRCQTHGRVAWLAVGAVMAFLMSLTRNVTLQFVAAGLAAATLSARGSLSVKQSWMFTGVTVLLSVAALALYSLWNWHHYGNFWHVFTVQSHWEKRLGLDVSLLWRPKTWTPSTNVLLWDVLAFYLPVIIGVAGLIFWLRDRRGQSPNAAGLDYTFWFSVAFAGAHVGIVWLSQPDFHSLARYVFASPFVFLALGYILERLPPRTVIVVLTVWLGLSAVYLANWWGRYGRISWLG